jgi:hypothetical protein
VTTKTKRGDVISAFGEPAKSWNDGVSGRLQYESPIQTIEFICDVNAFWRKPEGKLTYVEVADIAPKDAL